MSEIRGTGEIPAVLEDTIDLSDRLDPVRSLLRRAALGDQQAAASLVGTLAPRIHGLAVHVTGSTAKAEKATISVLRSVLRDAAALAASGLPGEAAVLDRARRAVVTARADGDVRSLVGPESPLDRTRDRREAEVLRVLLDLAPHERVIVESAAQGRFTMTGPERQRAAVLFSTVLDRLVSLGGTDDVETRALAALDALALADAGEQQRLRELTATAETAIVHRHAIEGAARLTVLTAVPPSHDLRIPVLEGFGAAPAGGAAQVTDQPLPGVGPPPGAAGSIAPSGAGAAGSTVPGRSPSGTTPAPTGPLAPAPGPETAYRGDYATPVLGTDTQRRMVGPPAMAGGIRSGTSASSAATPLPPDAEPAPMHPGESADADASAPSFAFRPADEASRSRRTRRQQRRREREQRWKPRRAPWLSRSVAVIALVAALVLGGLLWNVRRDLAASQDFTHAWAEATMADGAQIVRGASDNGTWLAVITADTVVLRAEGVQEYEGEVLQLWGHHEGVDRDLGVLEVGADGVIEVSAEAEVDKLFITREMKPGQQSGSPSPRVVASLDPALNTIGG